MNIILKCHIPSPTNKGDIYKFTFEGRFFVCPINENLYKNMEKYKKTYVE